MNELEIFKGMIKPELMVLIPVIMFIGFSLKKISKVKDEFIPIILGIIGIFFSLLYVLATNDINSTKTILICIFISFTQGFLVAGAAVYINQIYKQKQNIKKEMHIGKYEKDYND